MKKQDILTINSIIFVTIALLHVWRGVMGAEAVIAGIHIPLWASYVAVVVAVALAYLNWNA